MADTVEADLTTEQNQLVGVTDTEQIAAILNKQNLASLAEKLANVDGVLQAVEVQTINQQEAAPVAQDLEVEDLVNNI